MGRRGPPPQPTALKILHGNPGKRPLNKQEPKPQEFAAEPPDTLNDEGRAQWERLIVILKGMKVLTEADYIALGNLCSAYQTQLMAQRQLAQAGILYRTQSGYIQASPLFSIVRCSMELVFRYLKEFGLTPSSRVLVRAEHTADDDEWAEFGVG